MRPTAMGRSRRRVKDDEGLGRTRPGCAWSVRSRGAELGSRSRRGGPVRTLKIGLVLPMGESFVDGSTARWVEIRDLAVRAE